jgi:hypothetical protein
MRSIALLSLPVLLSACASASAPREVPATREDRNIVSVTGGSAGMNLQLTREAAITSGVIAAAPDSVWAAVPRVFAQLELPVTGVNTSSRVLTATGQRMRRIGGRSIATFFECPGPYGNAAASSDVYVTVVTQVLPGAGAGSSTVRTEVAAHARSNTSGRQVPCTTKGALEKQLMEALAAEAGAGAG